MGQEVDVLDMVVRLVAALGLLLGLPGVDALQNAQPPAPTQTQGTTTVSALQPIRAERTVQGARSETIRTRRAQAELRV